MRPSLPMPDNNQERDNSIAYSDILQKVLEKKLAVSWNDYYQLINDLPASYKIAPSLKLLNLADSLMNLLNSGLLESTLLERHLIGGISDTKTLKEFNLDTELLGGMSSFPSFKKVLKNDAEGVQKLLKIIPANGKIDGWHYMQFSDGYKDLLANNGIKQAPLYPATRLLSMKRPDQFVCITPDTDANFYQAFNCKPLKKQELQRYWDDIILTIQKTEWFKQDLPMDVSQLAIYRSRVCLLERILSQPDLNFVEGDINDTTQLEQEEEIHIETTEHLSTTSQNTSNEPVEINTVNSRNSTQRNTVSANSENIISKNGIDIDQTQASVYKTAKQPKKMTIAKRKSDKVNQNAATKLMSQYYFANKAKFAKIDMGSKRALIIEKLCNGESVEEAFESLL